jgi:Ubiquitin carboxyl-terminal hydrolase, family 1
MSALFFIPIRTMHDQPFVLRLLDMKHVDRRLRDDAKSFAQKQKQAAKKPTASKAKQPKRAKKGKKSRYILEDDNTAIEDLSELGFHFTAYIPAHNHLWRMDGLQREPESLGTLSNNGNWLDMAVAELSAQWQSAAENEIEFSLLSLVAAREDGTGRVEENVRAGRMREDWGPALAELVRAAAEWG